MSFKYHRSDYNLATLPVDHIDRLTLERMLPRQKVLELGCATGYMTRYLTRHLHCQVTGVDISAKVKPAIVGDLNLAETWDQISHHQPFDTVLAANILEHLIDPHFQLTNIRRVLRPDGRLVIVVPNIAWWRSRWRLLKGIWNYETYGLFDETHLRFFSLASLRRQLISAGFVIEDEAYDPAGGAKWLTPLLKLFPNAYAYQVVMVARRKSYRRPD